MHSDVTIQRHHFKRVELYCVGSSDTVTPSEHLVPVSLGLTVMVALPSTELFGLPPPPLSSEERGTTIAGGQKDLKRTFLRMKIDLRGPTTRDVHMHGDVHVKTQIIFILVGKWGKGSNKRGNALFIYGHLRKDKRSSTNDIHIEGEGYVA